MRLLPLLPLFSLVALTLALPVPEAPTISALQDRDLTLIDGRATGPVEFYDERSVGSDSFDERAFEDDYAVEERDFEPDYDVEERDFDESPLDLELRSEGEPVQQPSLYRKDAGDQVEPRMAGAIVQGAQALAEGIMAIVKLIKGKVAKEKEMRNTWTQWLIAEVRKKIGKNWNALVIHPKHEYKFAGVKGKDWYHKHFEFKNSVIKGTTTGYDLYWFKEGEVLSKGDGGFLNWCYNGLIKSTQILRKKRTLVKFGRPT
ncbi:hypothetical protein FA13DRAFT_1810329 [Coprinellus micaceus]|uniref:Uncharacterized protein n=1 Tax=Coprinellus micaceus TaxID=71717 RepID=A0A4Y7TRA5_COPMI|nr:hypothetical protein FA13DRAFT_1810329 [Coprinellus micaceus]